MKALILAAGRGTRIRSVHGERPKCLINVHNSSETILDHQIEGLLASGVSQIGIVVGYMKEQIIRHVHVRHRRHIDKFRFITNHNFAKTNNIYSLWMARNWVGDDAFVVLNADVVCDARMLAPALRSRTPITMIVDPEWRDETMKVVITNGQVVRMAKGIPQSEFSGTYIGITAFSAAINQRFFDNVSSLIEAGRVNDFFNVAVQRLADEGVKVGYSATNGMAWAEIDDPGDLAFAKAHIFPNLSAMATAA